jgi:hypothetical protein
VLYKNTRGKLLLSKDMLLSKQESEIKVNNLDILSNIKDEYQNMLDENNKLKLVILKVFTKVNVYECDELKRDTEINVILNLSRNAFRRF